MTPSQLVRTGGFGLGAFSLRFIPPAAWAQVMIINAARISRCPLH